MPSEVIREPPKWARALLGGAVLVAIVLALGTVLSAARAGGAAETERIPTREIPQGLATRSIGGFAGITSRQGDDIIVLAGGSPHPRDVLVLCAATDTIMDQVGSSAFDRYGIKHGGPAPRSLDRFAVVRDGDDLVVDTGRIEYRDGEGHPMEPPSAVQPQPRLLPYSAEWDQAFHAQPTWCTRLRE